MTAPADRNFPSPSYMCSTSMALQNGTRNDTTAEKWLPWSLLAKIVKEVTTSGNKASRTEKDAIGTE
ncbi:unnamed protein product [Urochloa humidicola]